MTRLYLVTSAIHTPFGIYHPQERLYQTLATLHTIKTKDPGARILLIEAGAKNLTQNELSVLQPYMSDFVNLTQHPKVIKVHENVQRQDVIKNIIEAFILQFTLTLIQDKKNDFSRIFKVSGRYLLQESFNAQTHEIFTGKYIFKESDPSPLKRLNIGFDRGYQTRLWSMCPTLFDETLVFLQKAQECMVQWTSPTFYMDLEHITYALLSPNKIVTQRKIGVGGRLAPNGMWVED